MIRTRLFCLFILVAISVSCSQTVPPEMNADDPIVVAVDKDSSSRLQLDTASFKTAGKDVAIDTAFGDLDKDGVSEMAIVSTTPRATDLFGFERRLDLYKRGSRGWRKWHESIGPVLPSDAGGMMGDPFQGIEIKDGKLYIYHFGGSRQKWNYIHQFRFQDGDWYLIGATAGDGAPCYYFEWDDYNLVTGDGQAALTKEDCGDGDTAVSTTEQKFRFKLKPSELPKMNGFRPGDNLVKIPGRKEDFYY